MAPAALRNDRSVRELLDDRGIALPNGLEGARVSRSGCFLTTTLPGDLGDSDLVVFIPAYNRQLSDDGKSLGTLPLLVRDLAEAGAREGVGITVPISDDSREREAALNERALGVALDVVDTVPDIYLVGRQERGITFEEIAEELERNLRSRLPCHGKQPAEAEVEYHLNKLRCLATHHVGIVDLALIARTQSIERSAKLPENRGFRLHESRFQHEISLKLTVPPPVVPGTKSGFDG